MIGNQKGSITLMGALISSILALALIFLIVGGKYLLLANHHRSQTYLCTKYMIKSLDTYSKVINGGNLALIALQTLAIVAPELLPGKKLIIAAQEAAHILTMGKIIRYRHCTTWQRLAIIRAWPFQTIGMLKLKRLPVIDTVKQIQKNKWSTIIPSLPPRPFIIKLNFKKKQNLMRHWVLSCKEIKVPSSLNGLVGDLLSSLF